MTEKKITKKDNIKGLLALNEVKANKQYVDFLNHELELLEKKAGYKSDKPTAKQVENTSIKDGILAAMVKGEKYRITDMLKQFECCAELSNQRVSALVRQLLAEGKVERFEEKRVAYFALAD